jgi:hypothetical protein
MSSITGGANNEESGKYAGVIRTIEPIEILADGWSAMNFASNF